VKKIVLGLLLFVDILFALDMTPKEVPVYRQIDMTYDVTSIEDAIANPDKFQTTKSFNRLLRRKKDNDNLWLRIPLSNTSNTALYKAWIARWERASFDLYTVSDGTIYHHETIHSDKYLKQSSALFIPPNSERELYIHVKTAKALDQFSYFYFVDATAAEEFIISTEKYYHHGFLFGVLLTMSMYSFFMYFSIKAKEYLYLGIYQTWVLITTCDLWQYFYILLQNHPNIAHFLLNDLYAYSIMFFSIIFTKAFLNTKEKMPRFNTFLNYSIVLLIPLDLWYGPVYYGAFIPIIFIMVGFYYAYKGNLAALFYAFGFLGFVLYYLLINLSRIFDWGIYLEFTNARQIFTCVEAFVFSNALYLKLKSIVQEKNAAQESSFRYEKMMLEQSRFASMGEMIASIAHQWRQPLNHLNLILNNLRLAHRNHKLTSEYLESKATEAEQQLNYMSTTIEDFSKFFATKGKQEEFRLKEVCEYAMKLVASRTEKKQIVLRLDCADDCVHTNYKNELVHVLTILLNNAFDALNAQNKKSGFIVMRVTCNEISIEDNAGGIAEDIMPYIFDPYFSTKNKKFGTGLGLYVATMLVKNLIKGELYAQNTLNGCCFTLSFSPQENHH